jgi:hypothetical protein
MMFDLTNERGFINEGWKPIASSSGIVAARGDQANSDAAARQAYIALGVALVALPKNRSTQRRWKVSIRPPSTKFWD